MNQRYDLVILDLGLPSARGLDVLRGISPQNPDFPVVILINYLRRNVDLCSDSNYPRSGYQIGKSAKIS